jgi:hypothetical protein
MTCTLRLAAPAATLLLLAACDPTKSAPIDPGVAALSLPNAALTGNDLDTSPIPAGRPVQVYVTQEAAFLGALRGAATFEAQAAVTGTTAAGGTRLEYRIPAELRDQPGLLVAVVILDPADPAFAAFDLNGRTRPEIDSALAAGKVVVGYARGRSMLEPTTVLTGGRAYSFTFTRVLPGLPADGSGWWDTSTGAVPHPDQDVAAERSRNGERIVAGEYVLLNNQWNYTAALGALSTRIFVKQDGTFGWEWSSERSDAVVAYPAILYGETPWHRDAQGHPLRTTTALPIPFGSAQVRVDLSVATAADGVYDTAFDIWVSSAAHPASPTDLATEIMIWTDRKGMLFYPGGALVDHVTLGGIAYDVYYNPTVHGFTTYTWSYVAFLPEHPIVSGPLELGPFFDYLLAKEYVAPGGWLSSIEFGCEVTVGSGATEVSGAAITLH